MKTFLSANTVIGKENKKNNVKIDLFIDAFNKYIKRKQNKSDTCFYMNNGLDKIPMLNDTEFKLAVKLARKKGWNLTWHEDNYDTITYKMEKI